MQAEDVPGVFNADLLATAVVTAWLDALANVQERLAAPSGGVHTASTTLYNALPDPQSVAARPAKPQATREDLSAGTISVFLASKVGQHQVQSTRLAAYPNTSSMKCWLCRSQQRFAVGLCAM